MNETYQRRGRVPAAVPALLAMLMLSVPAAADCFSEGVACQQACKGDTECAKRCIDKIEACESRSGRDGNRGSSADDGDSDSRSEKTDDPGPMPDQNAAAINVSRMSGIDGNVWDWVQDDPIKVGKTVYFKNNTKERIHVDLIAYECMNILACEGPTDMAIHSGTQGYWGYWPADHHKTYCFKYMYTWYVESAPQKRQYVDRHGKICGRSQ